MTRGTIAVAGGIANSEMTWQTLGMPEAEVTPIVDDRANPVLVEVTRGGAVESLHRGAAAVASADGRLVAAWGDIDRAVFPRSAVKPFQVLPMLETGAAERLRVSDAELALACGSHGGEPRHVEVVSAWLARMGLGATDLLCGPHAPLSASAAQALLMRGESPSALHNNCSGKHTAFLATALHLRESTVGYCGPVHPVQLRVRRILAQLAGRTGDIGEPGIDGCGAPVFPMPLRCLAVAMARLAAPDSVSRLHGEALRRVAAAMTAHPDLVGGEGRFDTSVIGVSTGAIIVKTGAEGVLAAALPRSGQGIAVKIDDGAKRAAEAAGAAVLLAVGGFDGDIARVLAGYRESPVRSAGGGRVGVLRTASGWL